VQVCGQTILKDGLETHMNINGYLYSGCEVDAKSLILKNKLVNIPAGEQGTILKELGSHSTKFFLVWITNQKTSIWLLSNQLKLTI